MLKDKLSLVILSCDKFSDLWNSHLQQLEKYWGDREIDTYIVTDKLTDKKYKNINFVGLLPQEELPNRIKNFDLCLNIFRNDDLSKDVSPLKFYEYLATGKPVVSTPVPLQVRDYDSCIYIAETTDEFVAKCKEALAETIDSPKRAMRLEEARKCSWDERVKTMRNILSW